MNTNYRQTGKGITGFIVGLLLATIIIAGVLFYLNKSKSDFKTPTRVGSTAPVKPEIITPIPPASSPMVSAPDQSQYTLSEMASNASETMVPDQTVTVNPTGTEIKKPHVPAIAASPDHTHSNSSAQSLPKVTPEQILNSGSVEKARQNNKTTEDKVIMQIGSYSHQTDAEAQRAKLVMLGIESHVRTAQVNGVTKYRVQTNPISRNQANQMRQILQQHNIDNLIRSAS
ncbi:SPOR domain-containing protein [Neisseriaceae bacterium ESL0693]|nr:SPOR domain-containing protein [Neisseriaceae bacterium ESL0693]